MSKRTKKWGKVGLKLQLIIAAIVAVMGTGCATPHAAFHGPIYPAITPPAPREG